MYLKLILINLIFLLQCNIVSTQTCCSGGIPLSNNIGLDVLEKGSFQIGINYDYNNLNTLKNESEDLNDDSRLRVTNSILVNLNYSFSDNFSVEGLLTWVNQRREITQFGNVNKDETSGIGDGVLLAKYKFDNIFNNTGFINMGLGAKIPLGSSTEKNIQGITLNADLQPGSNAWDIIYWMSIAKSFNFRPSLYISGRFTYRSTGTNTSYFGDSSYKIGNEFQAYFGLSDQFLITKIITSPSLNFKYRNANQDKISGFNLSNTGGNWLFVIPNIAINVTKNWIFSTSVELPIYSKVDGTQLTPTFRMNTGVLFTFPSKNIVSILN